MPVTPRHAGTRVVGEAAHAEFGRSQSLPREPPLHWHVPRADIAKVVEVLLRPVGHPETLALGPPLLVRLIAQLGPGGPGVLLGATSSAALEVDRSRSEALTGIIGARRACTV